MDRSVRRADWLALLLSGIGVALLGFFIENVAHYAIAISMFLSRLAPTWKGDLAPPGAFLHDLAVVGPVEEGLTLIVTWFAIRGRWPGVRRWAPVISTALMVRFGSPIAENIAYGLSFGGAIFLTRMVISLPDNL